MKQRKFFILIEFLTIIAMVCLISSGTACCFPPDDSEPDPLFEPLDTVQPPPPAPPSPPGLMLLLKAQEENILSKITGKSIEDVKTQLACKPIPLYLEENSISPDTFRKAMDEQLTKLISLAEKEGIITRKQSDEIQERIKNDKPSPPCRCHF